MTDPGCQERPPSFLFSDRGWIVKALITLGIFAALCRLCYDELTELFADMPKVAAPQAGLVGKRVHSRGRRVVKVGPDGFDLATKAGPVHIISPSPALHEGDYVSVVGRVVGTARVEASVVQLNPAYLWRRGFNYGISAVTVLAFLWLVRRRFRWRPETGLFRSRF